VRDLRLCTNFRNDFHRVAITPFPVAVKRVYDDVLRHQTMSN
jgi:UDP-glucose 4-epimerase